MSHTAPRKRPLPFSEAAYQPTPASATPAASPAPPFHSRSFAATPPYATTSLNPYGKPGFFLTPHQSLAQPHLPRSMWLWPGTRSHYVGLLSLLVCCVLVFTFVTNMSHPLELSSANAAGGSFGASRQQQQPGVDFDVHAALRPLVKLEPTVTTLSSFHVPTHYQRTTAQLQSSLSAHPQLLSHLQDTDHPTPLDGERAEKGLVILLHGCSHPGSDWFALPEERRTVRLLLASGYSAVAFTSVDRDSGCWDNRWKADNADMPRVIAALQAFIAEQYSDGNHPPLFIIGVSSGGTFSSLLARAIPVTAQCIIVSPGSDKALLKPATHSAAQPYTEWSSAILASDAERLYSVPPTAWLYMVKDTQWASEAKISHTRDSMQAKGKALGHRVATSAQGTLLLPLKQHPLTKSHMAERIDGWTERQAARFYALAHREGFVDRYDYLTDNPRSSGAAQYLVEAMEREAAAEGAEGEGGVVMREQVASVHEELAVLWGAHEMTSERMDEVVLWMERQRTRAA